MQNLDTGFDQITNLQTEVASRLTRLDSASSMLSITKNTLETIRGNVQDADMYKLGVQLTQQQTAFEASGGNGQDFQSFAAELHVDHVASSF